MNRYEQAIHRSSILALTAFIALNLVTFSGVYGWLHPAMWGVVTLTFLVVETGFYVLAGPRSKTDVALTAPIWASLGAWISVEHFTVVLAVIVALRAIRHPWLRRALGLVFVGGILSLVKVADINPWSSAPGKPWLQDLFLASCILNAMLVVVSVVLPEPEGLK